MKNSTETLKDKAEKLDRYINLYVSRSVKIEEALGITGQKLLDELLKQVSEL
tara:strand:+ start:621 stop:776 length:156 start_codon:yes stop_codon:yes gene_type:complete